VIASTLAYVNDARFRSTGLKVLLWLINISALQKQKATFIEGEGKSGDNFRLGFSIEIHQAVTAHQQVDPGDGRILN